MTISLTDPFFACYRDICVLAQIEQSKVVQKFRVRLLKGDGEWAKFGEIRLTYSFSSKGITKQHLWQGPSTTHDNLFN
jgi:hypothetical protein